MLAAMAGRGVVAALAAALRVPGAHVAALAASGALPPSAPSAAAIAAPLSQPLLAGEQLCLPHFAKSATTAGPYISSRELLIGCMLFGCSVQCM